MTQIEYFYSAHSAFAWLGSAKVMKICADHGAKLVHRPIPLSPVVEAQGSLPFHDRTQAHVDYFFGREIERWAEWRDVPTVRHRPTHHDADYTIASGMILALGDQGPAVDAMAHAILGAHWRDDADLSRIETLHQIAASLGHGPDLIDRAQTAEVTARYAANGTEARKRGVMGSPTYVVDGDIFYGQDRLDMVARALRQPFTPTTWRNPPVG